MRVGPSSTSLRRGRYAIVRLVTGRVGIRQANREAAEVGDRFGAALAGMVVLDAPPIHELSLADRYLVRIIENLVALEGGSLRLASQRA
jgi:hypothetical protein